MFRVSKRSIKWNMDRRDHDRALLTETAPYEVPLIFSNNGFYKNLHQIQSASPNLRDVITRLFASDKRDYTIPLRYKISKNLISTRQLSLLHPAAQYQVSKFYAKYENLICYYCGSSPFSMRYPAKIGSSYFFSGTRAEVNRYRKDAIDTVADDKAVRNPASYFAYRQYDRLYKFFRSAEFLRLEKKFSYMWMLDVSSCFGSIYTHTITWALKDINEAKNNVWSESFGSDFDKLMQKMNFNETNGICIGPEVSRLFAELILQKIDRNVVKAAAAKNLHDKQHYECRRYVDDYILFAQTEEVAIQIRSLISDCLAEFKLDLNEQKIEKLVRPFQTKKTQIIEDLGEVIEHITEVLVEPPDETFKGTFPARLFRPDAVVKSAIRKIKGCCFEHQMGFDAASNYVVSGLCRTLEGFINSHSEAAAANKEIDEDRYVTAFLVILEVVYFLYTVAPTVSTSFKVAKASVLSFEFFKSNFPDRSVRLGEQLSNWMLQIVRSLRPSEDFRSAIPIELVNVLLALSVLDVQQLLTSDRLSELLNINEASYFTLVSALFYVKDRAQFADIRDAVMKRADHILSAQDMRKHAEAAHLAMDLLACPYLPHAYREALATSVVAVCGINPLAPADVTALVAEIQSRPWFVGWASIDMLSMIRKKELSAVY